MNALLIDIIYKHLEESIDEGYRAGLRSIVKQNRRNKKLFTFFKDPAFNIAYTDADEMAIDAFKRNAFRVAGVGSYDLEEELKELGVDLLDTSLPDFDLFELEVREKFLKYGIGLGDQPPGGWIKQNIDTAIKSSHATARWNRVNDPDVSGVYTHWMYMTQSDERVRDEHVRLHGMIFPIDDASAASMVPPLDWGCRCYETYLTGAEIEGYAAPNDDQMQELLEKVPVDFRHSPADADATWKNWISGRYKDMGKPAAEEIEKMVKQKFDK